MRAINDVRKTDDKNYQMFKYFRSLKVPSPPRPKHMDAFFLLFEEEVGLGYLDVSGIVT